jgi:phosphonopyruvate decarboxylase
MQNSGLGNAINPLISLVDKDVYSIPMLLMIGWRGEPGVKDEPQHVKQGKVTIPLLQAMGIPYLILDGVIENATIQLEQAIKKAKVSQGPFALIIRKGLFDTYKLSKKHGNSTQLVFKREEAIKVIIDNMDADSIVVSTTGKTSRELFEYRELIAQGHQHDFLTVGSMGHANQIALGIALQKPTKQIICFDGDGALIMHSGSFGIIASLEPKNFIHIVFNNGSHESVGGQPTIGDNIDFCKIATGFGYKKCVKVSDKSALKKAIDDLSNTEGPLLIEVKVAIGSRDNLGRPSISPTENKGNLMKFLQQ